MGKKSLCLVLFLFLGVVFINSACAGVGCEGTQFQTDAGLVYIRNGQCSQVKISGESYSCCGCGSCTPSDSGSLGAVPFGGAGSSKALAQQMALGLIQQMITAALSPPQDDSAYLKHQEEMEKAKEEAKKKEMQRKAVMWQQMQKEAEAKKKKDQEQLIAILGKNDSSESDSSLKSTFELFSLGQSSTDLQIKGTGGTDTSKLSATQQLLCAAYFSQLANSAAKTGNEEKAKYLSGQAEKAMSGQVTDEPCQFSNIPDVPIPQGIADEKQYKDMIAMVQEEIKKLQDLNTKLKNVEDKKKQVQDKKKNAEKDIDDRKIKAINPRTKEGNKEKDDLLLKAQQILKDSQEELAALDKEEKVLINLQNQIKDKLKKMQENIETTALK